MKICTSEEIRELDSKTIGKIGIPSIVLMENAAIQVVNNLQLNNNKNIIIICGSGNNGGDGLAVARHLLRKDVHVEVFIIDSLKKRSEDFAVNFNIFKNIGGNFFYIDNENDIKTLREKINTSDMVIDSIFGTGLTRNIKGLYNDVIDIINKNSKYTVSIDIPSGLHSNTGKVLGNCIVANKTICFQTYKLGFVQYNSMKYTGEIIVCDIGIPENILKEVESKVFFVDDNFIKKNIAKRDRIGHKGDFGRCLTVAGSEGFAGSAYIVTQSAVRTGSGLVTLATNKDVLAIVSSKLIEAMTCDYNSERFINLIENADVIAFGPGLGNNQRTKVLLNQVINQANCPIVLDADGINVLENNIKVLNKIKKEVIITPHLGEMARITGKSIDFISENRIDVAKTFAKDNNIIVLLKGYNTIITDGDLVYINPTGNSKMASGGVGDCLTGVIASLIGQGLDGLSAAASGAYIHGFIGDVLSQKMFIVNSNHIIENIPSILKKMLT